MRIESSVTTLSWIPSELVPGALKLPFEVGFTHYDDPPPDRLPGDSVDEGLQGLRADDGFRFANHLAAWIDVDDGRIVGHGQSGHGLMGATTVRFGVGQTTFETVAMPDLLPSPEVGARWVTFRQTTGGRTGLPAPRRVKRKPFVQLSAPLVWTTLELTLHADGRVAHRLPGASRFPRHWVYDGAGELVAKAGLTDFKTWFRTSFGRHTPWGDVDTPAFVTEVESALERELATLVMRGGSKPRTRTLRAGEVLMHEGDEASELYLLLDGVLAVDVGGTTLAELGPGAIVGERAVLEGGRRTATLRAVTDGRVAVAPADQLDRAALQRLSEGHHREDREPGRS